MLKQCLKVLQGKPPELYKEQKKQVGKKHLHQPGQFFAAVDRRNASVTTGSHIASAEVHERDVTEVPDVPTTIATTTTPPVALDVEPRGTSSPRISFPEGSPSHAPLLLLHVDLGLWMQQITERQINEPRREDASSSESNTSAIETLPEDIPDELGYEWRVLHPFELPGVRFPIDSTAPKSKEIS